MINRGKQYENKSIKSIKTASKRYKFLTDILEMKEDEKESQ